MKECPNEDGAMQAASFILIGCTQREAAKRVGVAEETVCRWTKQPWWPGIVARAARDPEYNLLIRKARSVLYEAMDSDSEGTRLRAAQFVLKNTDAMFNKYSTAKNAAELASAEERLAQQMQSASDDDLTHRLNKLREAKGQPKVAFDFAQQTEEKKR